MFSSRNSNFLQASSENRSTPTLEYFFRQMPTSGLWHWLCRLPIVEPAAASPSASDYRILEYPYSGDCSCMDMPWLWEWPYPSGASSFALACLYWIMLCTQWTQSVFFSSNSTWEMLHSGDIVLLSRDKKFRLLPCLRRKSKEDSLFATKVFLRLTSKFVGHNKRKLPAEEKLIGHSVTAECVMKTAGELMANNGGNIIRLLRSLVGTQLQRLGIFHLCQQFNNPSINCVAELNVNTVGEPQWLI